MKKLDTEEKIISVTVVASVIIIAILTYLLVVTLLPTSYKTANTNSGVHYGDTVEITDTKNFYYGFRCRINRIVDESVACELISYNGDRLIEKYRRITYLEINRLCLIKKDTFEYK